jgi:ubiquinone biosynthesis UbiH/UbiF/VisC/COQ6 family hydroxylase
MSVALLAQQRPAAPAEAFDSRVYALTPGNAAFLRQIDAWPERATPVHGMRIHGDESSMLEFDAYSAGVPELAWIVEDARLQAALWRDLEFVAGECRAMRIEQDWVTLSLDDRSVEARLVVGADGANSFVRERAGIAVRERDYGQRAVVANFRCAKPHQNVAYQWFQRGAVLALLPLAGDHVSMVWSRSTPVDDVCAAVEEASGGVLGALELLAPPRSFPLRRLAAERLVAPRVALAGDAGHVIHPLAGQGLNLGLQDARELAHVLLSREPRRDPGDLGLLRRYERARAEPILAMDTMVDSLFRLFGADSAVLSRLRNGGLNLTDRLPVIKNMLMRQAMQ